jgi:hypothetical protein
VTVVDTAPTGLPTDTRLALTRQMPVMAHNRGVELQRSESGKTHICTGRISG